MKLGITLFHVVIGVAAIAYAYAWFGRVNPFSATGSGHALWGLATYAACILGVGSCLAPFGNPKPLLASSYRWPFLSAIIFETVFILFGTWVLVSIVYHGGL